MSTCTCDRNDTRPGTCNFCAARSERAWAAGVMAARPSKQAALEAAMANWGKMSQEEAALVAKATVEVVADLVKFVFTRPTSTAVAQHA